MIFKVGGIFLGIWCWKEKNVSYVERKMFFGKWFYSCNSLLGYFRVWDRSLGNDRLVVNWVGLYNDLDCLDEYIFSFLF